MEQKHTERRFLSGLRHSDFVGLLNELFDEEYAEEVLETYKKAEFIRDKFGVYYGKIITDMHTFYVVCEKNSEGWKILEFDFE